MALSLLSYRVNPRPQSAFEGRGLLLGHIPSCAGYTGKPILADGVRTVDFSRECTKLRGMTPSRMRLTITGDPL
jgi:hypothetical protein